MDVHGKRRALCLAPTQKIPAPKDRGQNREGNAGTGAQGPVSGFRAVRVGWGPFSCTSGVWTPNKQEPPLILRAPKGVAQDSGAGARRGLWSLAPFANLPFTSLGAAANSASPPRLRHRILGTTSSRGMRLGQLRPNRKPPAALAANATWTLGMPSRRKAAAPRTLGLGHLIFVSSDFGEGRVSQRTRKRPVRAVIVGELEQIQTHLCFWLCCGGANRPIQVAFVSLFLVGMF